MTPLKGGFTRPSRIRARVRKPCLVRLVRLVGGNPVRWAPDRVYTVYGVYRDYAHYTVSIRALAGFEIEHQKPHVCE